MARLGQFTELSRKVVAVGRNYADHAKELGNAVPATPLLFMKPPSAFVTAGGRIEVPPGCAALHHEIELGVVVGRRCRRVTEEQAMAHVGGYCLALDMTARDRQEEAKAKGHPWTMAKVGVPPITSLLQMFDTSLPVSPFIPLASIPDPQDLTLWCKVTRARADHLHLPGERRDEAGGPHQRHDLPCQQAPRLHLHLLHPGGGGRGADWDAGGGGAGGGGGRGERRDQGGHRDGVPRHLLVLGRL